MTDRQRDPLVVSAPRPISGLSSRPKPRALSHHRLNRPRVVPAQSLSAVSQSPIYGAGFSRRNSSRGDVGQYPALKHGDLV